MTCLLSMGGAGYGAMSHSDYCPGLGECRRVAPSREHRQRFLHSTYLALAVKGVGRDAFDQARGRLPPAIRLSRSFATLMQLRFASFAVINLRRDLHPQECAHAGSTSEQTRRSGFLSLPRTV